MKRSNDKRGSIIIMMTLIMIIASIYITTSLFDVRGTVDQERLYKTKKHVGYMQNAIADYRTNNTTRLLNNFEELLSQGSQTSCTLLYSSSFLTMQVPTNWCGPYIDISLFMGTSTAYKEDAWGNIMQIASSGTSGDYTYMVYSCGENGTCGTCTIGTPGNCSCTDSDDICMSF